ncbi:hypothetical protein ES708_27820 [subsurface metagenome]
MVKHSLFWKDKSMESGYDVLIIGAGVWKRLGKFCLLILP